MQMYRVMQRDDNVLDKAEDIEFTILKAWRNKPFMLSLCWTCLSECRSWNSLLLHMLKIYTQIQHPDLSKTTNIHDLSIPHIYHFVFVMMMIIHILYV